MKCPKCGYLGFDSVDRCRNCGYDFSLVPVQPPPELPLRAERGSSRAVVDELPLSGATTAPDGAVTQVGRDAVDHVLARDRNPSGTRQASDGDLRPRATDLPLFGSLPADEAPLVAVPSRLRAPLSVRRATPSGTPRRVVPPRAPRLDLPPQETTRAVASEALPGEGAETTTPPVADSESAGLGPRVAAAAIDLGILASIDLVVVYFTLRICGLAMADLSLVPKSPLIAFLIVQNGGYLVAFNVGGQTLGKMVAGIRVVSMSGDLPLDLSHAVLRAVVWVALAVPAGLGFLSAVLSHDHRGFHDRCAGTRVIRTSPA